MIIEDENGNDIDLRDLDDREPGEPEDESLSLEQIEELYAAYQRGTGSEFVDATAILLRDAVPQLIAELRRLDTRNEYTITDGDHPANDARLMPEAQVDFVLAHPETLKHVWVRTVRVGPWVQLSSEAPF
jgi:hypothetical protein